MRRTLLLCAMVSAGLLFGPADAPARERKVQREEQREERRETRGGHDGDRSAAAARRAQQQNGGGRVLSVEPDGAGYRVKVLKDGEVRTHRVEGR